MATKLGEYEYSVDNVLGQGQFGIVYLGTHSQSKKKVAVKVLANQKNNDDAKKEIAVLKKVSTVKNDHIVHLLYFKETAKQLFVVMEFCDGGDLDGYIKEYGTMTEYEAHIFMKHMALGMQVLHDQKIIHRDLKPANVLLHFGGPKSENIDDITFKLADLGIARMLSPGELASTICGSPMFMAPELWLRQDYDEKVDLWSLGVVLCIVAANHMPIPPTALAFCMLGLPIFKPSIPTGLSPPLTDLITQTVESDPKQRISFDKFKRHPFLLTAPPKTEKPKKVITMRSCWGQTTTSGECLIHHLQFDEDRELLAFESTDGIKVEVYKGDITNENADAIVCSTNYNYSLQAGVSKAILATAGKELLKKCVDKFKAEGPLKEMQVNHLPACGNIKAKYIIFTVGPDGNREKDESKQCEILYHTVKNVLTYANNTLKAKSIAIPAISCGFRLVGLKPAVVAIAQATHSFLCEKDKKHLQLIRFVDINERLVVGIWQVFVKVMMNLGNEDDNEDEETLMVLKSTKILPGNN